jgi:Rieske Fe-S protein
MPEPSRRLILRVILKLFGLTALLFIVYILFSGDDEQATPATTLPPLLVDLNTLQPAQPQRLEWAGGPLQLLRIADNAPSYLFYDRGGKLGCPLSWQPPGTAQAPQQPWPGGFRDQCNSVWYLYDGKVLPEQASEQNLQSPPYRIIEGDLLEIGVNGDNAAPANSPVN